MSDTYAFGDTPTASSRLAVLATAFAPSTRALLALLGDGHQVRRVLDLGCGPGHTTQLLAGRFPRARVTWLDASAPFVAEARMASPDARTTFAVRDVTRVAANDAADVVYARFLLAHLPDVPHLVDTWLRATRPGGRLVLEEPEWIDGPDVVTAYLALSAARIERAGGRLFVGPTVSAALPRDHVLVDRVHHHRVPADLAATMFRMNLAVWGDRAVDEGSASRREVDGLDTGLAEVGDGGGHVDWGLRQVVVGAPDRPASAPELGRRGTPRAPRTT